MSAPRVSYLANLPTLEDPDHFRRSLSDIIEQHAVQINHTAMDMTTVSSNTTVAATLVIVETNSATVNITLIPALEWQDQVMRFKNIGSNPVQLLAAAGETVDRTATVSVAAALGTISVVSDGKEWWTV